MDGVGDEPAEGIVAAVAPTLCLTGELVVGMFEGSPEGVVRADGSLRSVVPAVAVGERLTVGRWGLCSLQNSSWEMVRGERVTATPPPELSDVGVCAKAVSA